MGRRDFQSTVADALPRIIEEQAKSGVGSVKFSKRDKKSIGKLYFRAGAVYAIELTTYNPNIVSRVVTNDIISDKNREQVIEKFKNKLTDVNVIDFVLKYQMFPEKPLMGYIKDYFFDAFDELYEWEGVNVEWRSNEEPPATALKVPNMNPVEVLEKIILRQTYLQDNLAQQWSIHPNSIDELHYCRNSEYTGEDYTTFLVLSVPTENEMTIGAIADYLGLSHFNTKKIIFDLWKQGIVDVIHPTGIRYTNRSQEDIENTQSENKPQLPTPNPPQTVKPETIVEPSIQITEPVLEIISEPIVAVNNNRVTETNSVSETYDLIGTPQTPTLSTPEQEQVDFEHQNFIPQTTNPTNKEKVMLTTQPNPTTSSASNRVRAMAEQLKTELKNLQESITVAEDAVNSHTQYVNSLIAERNLAINKLKTLDQRIAEGKASINAAQEEVGKLQKDYDESITFLN